MSPVHSAITRYGSSSFCRIASACARQLLERGVGILRPHDLHELDLVELMLADHAARVLAVAARFRAKARRVRGQLDRQRAGRQDLVAHRIGQRDFRRRDQVQRLRRRRPSLRRPCVTANMSASNFGNCVVPTSARRIDDVRRVALGVAMLLRVRVEHQLRERAMQAREIAAQEREARARTASPRWRNRACRALRRGRRDPSARIRTRAARPSGALRRCRRPSGRPASMDAVMFGSSSRKSRSLTCTLSSSRSSVLQRVAEAGDFARAAARRPRPCPWRCRPAATARCASPAAPACASGCACARLRALRSAPLSSATPRLASAAATPADRCARR